MAEIRYQLDEHIAHAVAHGLSRHGIDVVTTADLALIGASDTVQVEHALADGRVIFSQDRDFLRLHGRGVRHHGIVFCEHGSRSIGQIIDGLRRIHSQLSAEEMAGRLEYI